MGNLAGPYINLRSPNPAPGFIVGFGLGVVG